MCINSRAVIVKTAVTFFFLYFIADNKMSKSRHNESSKVTKEDEKNIITIEASEEDYPAPSNSGGRQEEEERRGRNGRRMRVRPRRSRHLQRSEQPPATIPGRQVPMKNAVMMLNEMFPPPGKWKWSHSAL